METVLLWFFGGFGVPATGWVILRGRKWISNALLRRRVKVRTFNATGHSTYMDDFYDELVRCVEHAHQDVYISGVGFDCSTAEGRAKADRLTNAFAKAMSRGVRVVRLQTAKTIDDGWLEHLGRLQRLYPDLFELYGADDERRSEFSSVASIDPDDTDGNVSEFMLELERHFGSDSRGIAGTAVFIGGHHLLAVEIRNRILEVARNPALSVRLTDHKHAQTFFGGVHYFAYGSNMDAQQMVSRCPTAMLVGVGVMRDTELVFNRRGSYRPGAVASIEPRQGKRVYGVIWKMSAADFKTLDAREDPQAYGRETATVMSLTGQPFLCHVYRSYPDGHDTPDLDYLRDLVEAARSASLPPEYIASLESLSVDLTANDEPVVPSIGRTHPDEQL